MEHLTTSTIVLLWRISAMTDKIAPRRAGVAIFEIEGDAVAEHEPWFGPKKLGGGWGPRTWQGWLIIAVFTIAVVVITVIATTHTG